jgi:hypothetical protein
MRTKTFGAAKKRLVHDCSNVSCRAQNRRASPASRANRARVLNGTATRGGTGKFVT